MMYEDVVGLLRYRPPGCAVKKDVIWTGKQQFIGEEGNFELETSCIPPTRILRASGHVDKFYVALVRDSDTDNFFVLDIS